MIMRTNKVRGIELGCEIPEKSRQGQELFLTVTMTNHGTVAIRVPEVGVSGAGADPWRLGCRIKVRKPDGELLPYTNPGRNLFSESYNWYGTHWKTLNPGDSRRWEYELRRYIEFYPGKFDVTVSVIATREGVGGTEDRFEVAVTAVPFEIEPN